VPKWLEDQTSLTVAKGLETIRAGIFGWKKAGARLWLPMFRGLEAEACAKAGDLEAGLQAIEEALAVSKETGGNLGAHR
jgi:hypothetical protein